MLFLLMDHQIKSRTQCYDKGNPMQLRLQIMRMTGRAYGTSSYFFRKPAPFAGCSLIIAFRKCVINGRAE